MNQHSSSKTKYYSPLIGAALVAASLFQFSFPVFAAGTNAGEILRNTATGNYEDDAGETYTIESNTVEVTVAQVAGITNQPSGVDFADNDNNTFISNNDTASFEFTITNVGNAISDIYIPDIAQITTRGLDRSTLVLEISDPDAALSSTASDNARTRLTNGLVEDVAIDGTVIVRVSGTVSATSSGAPIEVRLGNTGSNLDANIPVADTQNQPDTSDYNGDAPVPEEQAEDVRTVAVDSSDLVGGEKEASALQRTTLGSNPLAMARILKTRGDITPGDTSILTDDIIAYQLSLEVLSTTPNAAFTPADLEGRDFEDRITGLTTNQASNLILISDAIPANTKLRSNLSVNGDWRPVYSTETNQNLRADQITWSTTVTGIDNGDFATAQAARDTITRIGWVYDARTTDGNGPIEAGEPITTGFTFNVVTSGLGAGGGTIANIAQVFGSTVGGPIDTDGNPVFPVFDESGDQDPSNFDGLNAGPTEDDPLSTGIANPTSHGADQGNNTGPSDPNLSPGGEDNVVVINNAVASNLLNGPVGQPAATGNIFGTDTTTPDDNHDFQNKGISDFETAFPNAKHDRGDESSAPVIVTFTNTLRNPSTETLNDILLQPVPPEFNDNIFVSGDVTNDVIPVGTEVTLSLEGSADTATYVYTFDGTNYRFELANNSQPLPSFGLAAGVEQNYTVKVDLAADDPNVDPRLSTDSDVNGGFPIPLIAYSDTGSAGANGTPNVDDTYNLTVNQIYTGFVKIVKQVRVIDPDGNTRPTMDFNNDDANKEPRPGDTLEYRIIYRNISEPDVGSNNVLLNGVNVVIEENGTNPTNDPNGNTWAEDSNNDGDLDTINVQNSADNSASNDVITYFTGENGDISAGASDPGDTVTGYSTLIPLLPPTGKEDLSGLTPNADGRIDPWDETVDPGDFTFTFQRKVDEFDGLLQEGLD